MLKIKKSLEKENRFGSRDNTKEGVGFIKGKTKELKIRSSEHNLTKLILILF